MIIKENFARNKFETLTSLRVLSNIMLWLLCYRIKEETYRKWRSRFRKDGKQTILRFNFTAQGSLISLHTLEHLTVNQGVLGSSPRGAANKMSPKFIVGPLKNGHKMNFGDFFIRNYLTSLLIYLASF